MGIFNHYWTAHNAGYATRGAVAMARTLGEASLDSVATLSAKVREQHADIHDLTVLVSVLVKMLAEAGHVDEKTLRYRVEAELEAIAEAYKPGDEMVTCIRCRQSLKAAYTSVTEQGIVCDRCMATG